MREMTIFERLRLRFGSWLLLQGVRSLPNAAEQKHRVNQALYRYRRYERYVALCMVEGKRALPFDDWQRHAQKLEAR